LKHEEKGWKGKERLLFRLITMASSVRNDTSDQQSAPDTNGTLCSVLLDVSTLLRNHSTPNRRLITQRNIKIRNFTSFGNHVNSIIFLSFLSSVVRR